MIRRVAVMADRRNRGRPRVRRIRGRGVVLERLMMRNVVGLLRVGDGRGVAALAAGRAVGIDGAEVEAALEESPGDAGGVQKVADVLAAELDRLAGGGRADIADRIGIADEREAAVAVADRGAARVDDPW